MTGVKQPNWLRFVPSGGAIERAETDHTVVSLLSSRNGTEVIHHELQSGCSWAIAPQNGWDELETVYLLSGKLKYSSGELQGILQPGDTLSCEPAREFIIFTAVEPTSFLYICSNYVFYHYSESTKQFHKLAIEIAEKDGYTAQHCERIRRLSVLIGEKMGLSTTELFSLSYGAFFHDIGKINIPDEILLKPGRLSPEEFDIIKQHTIYGRDILNSSPLPYLAQGSYIAEQHHERYDGSGYPHALKGDQISIGAAIVAVVDSYDAMISNRPYQGAKSKSTAIEEILSLRGKLYHPKVVDTFLEAIHEYTDPE